MEDKEAKEIDCEWRIRKLGKLTVNEGITKLGN